MPIKSGSPGVIPETTGNRLLFVADNLGNLLSVGLSFTEGNHLGHTTWSGTNDAYSLLLNVFHLSFKVVVQNFLIIFMSNMMTSALLNDDY